MLLGGAPDRGQNLKELTTKGSSQGRTSSIRQTIAFHLDLRSQLANPELAVSALGLRTGHRFRVSLAAPVAPASFTP